MIAAPMHMLLKDAKFILDRAIKPMAKVNDGKLAERSLKEMV